LRTVGSAHIIPIPEKYTAYHTAPGISPENPDIPHEKSPFYDELPDWRCICKLDQFASGCMKTRHSHPAIRTDALSIDDR
jgi:hypothetical protein